MRQQTQKKVMDAKIEFVKTFMIFIAVSKDLVGDQGAAGGGKYAHVALEEIDISKSFLVDAYPCSSYIYIIYQIVMM